MNLLNVGKLLAVISQITTPSFIRVMNYVNEKGEVSNYIINLGINYGNAKLADALWLANPLNIIHVDFGSIPKKDAQIAWAEMYEAKVKPSQETLNRSEGQTDAYITICPNVRVHKATGKIFIYGFVVSKEVLVEGKYKAVNSSYVTIAKRKIGKHLKTENFRQLAFDKLKTIKAKGEEIVITL